MLNDLIFRVVSRLNTPRCPSCGRRMSHVLTDEEVPPTVYCIGCKAIFELERPNGNSPKRVCAIGNDGVDRRAFLHLL